MSNVLFCFLCFQLYYHGESINVNVHIANNSNRTVKKVKVAGKCFNFIVFYVCSNRCFFASIFFLVGVPGRRMSYFHHACKCVGRGNGNIFSCENYVGIVERKKRRRYLTSVYPSGISLLSFFPPFFTCTQVDHRLYFSIKCCLFNEIRVNYLDEWGGLQFKSSKHLFAFVKVAILMKFFSKLRVGVMLEWMFYVQNYLTWNRA